MKGQIYELQTQKDHKNSKKTRTKTPKIKGR